MFLVTAAGCLPATESKPKKLDKGSPPPGASMLGKEAGETRDDNGLRLKLVWCPPGTFTMGNPNPEAKFDNQVEVELTKGFWLGQTEVTQAEWKKLIGTEPWKSGKFTEEGDGFPATWVNWDEAMDFCRKLTDQERLAGRLSGEWEYTLPTDAQWERACRAGTSTTYSFGDDASQLGEYAWYRGNAYEPGERYPHRVRLKKPNPWGLYDMHGNADEWCRDNYAGKLSGGRDPESTIISRNRVIRGGSWIEDAPHCESAVRVGTASPNRGFTSGFRIACSSVR